jgi:putative transposase
MICSNDPLSIRRQTELLAVNRSSYYYGPPRTESAENLAIMNFMDAEYLEHPASGLRPLQALLVREGIVDKIGRDRLRRLRQKMGMLTVFRGPRTTIPGPPFDDSSLPAEAPRHHASYQVWCTDITYIRMDKGYLYLTVIMDWFSRRILAWELSNTLETGFCIKALERAIKVAGTLPEIMNTDQGCQYTSEEWRDAVDGRGIKMSMNGRRRWVDNVMVERFFRTIKYDEVYLWAYADGHEAHGRIGPFIDYYNFQRPHQSLANWCPDEVYRGINKDESAWLRK